MMIRFIIDVIVGWIDAIFRFEPILMLNKDIIDKTVGLELYHKDGEFNTMLINCEFEFVGDGRVLFIGEDAYETKWEAYTMGQLRKKIETDMAYEYVRIWNLAPEYRSSQDKSFLNYVTAYFNVSMMENG